MQTTLPTGLQLGPWFFNGDGTEAGTVRLVKDDHTFSERLEHEACAAYSDRSRLQAEVAKLCTPGPDGFWAEYPVGKYQVRQTRRYTLQIPLEGTSSTPTLVSHAPRVGRSTVLAVDYDNMKPILLQEESPRARLFLDDPDPASPDEFRWLTVDGKNLVDPSLLNCTASSGPCRTQQSRGILNSIGGYSASLGELGLNDDNHYHIFYLDLRTETFGISRRRPFNNETEYWLSHQGAAIQLGSTMNDLPWMEITSYESSRYGYEGGERNISNIPPGTIIYPTSGGNGVAYGRWEKKPLIHGQYELKPSKYPAISPPPSFGIDVTVDGSMLASGVLPNGETFNYLSGSNIESELGISLANQILLPISVR